MQFLKKNYHITISLTIFIISFVSCESTNEPPPFENVHDHQSTNFKPDVPSDLVLFQISDRQIDINWQNNSSYGTFFRIERKDGSGEFNLIGEVNIDSSHFTDTSGIHISTQYYYRVGAVAANGNIGYSEITDFSLYFSVPTNLSAQDSQRTNIILSWDYNSDFESGFIIERKKENDDFIEVGRTDKTIKTFEDKTLDTNYIYSHRVRAFTEINYSDPSSEIRVDFLPDCLPLGILVPGSSSSITKFQISPDGELIASIAYFPKEIRLYSARTGDYVKTLVGYSDLPTTICFSRNSELLAVAIGNVIEIWDILASQLITSLQFGAGDIVFSPDGLYMAANSLFPSNVTKLFDTSNWIFIREFEGRSGVDFSPDGVLIATGSNTSSGSMIKLWNVSNGSLFKVIDKPYANNLEFKFDASGKYIFGSDNSYIYGFEIESGNMVFRTQPIAGSWYFVNTDPLGRTFSAGGNYGRASLWRIKDFQISNLSGLGFNQTVYDGQYTPDGLNFAVLNDDGIGLWSLNYRWIQIN
jgi:hypothetical protein